MQYCYADKVIELNAADVYQNMSGRYFAAPNEFKIPYRLVINFIEDRSFIYTSYLARGETWNVFTRNKRSSIMYLLEEIHNGHLTLLVPSNDFLQLTEETAISFPVIRNIWEIL